MLQGMDYPIQSPSQLASHLRALRKVRGLNQAQLGAVLGVGQTRVTRIERDPAAISVAQFLDVLNALGVQMVLRAKASPPATAPGKVSGKSAAAGAAAKRRPTSEPW
jgi:HTH-type transcriptional regulator/antitoxin HipB